MERPELYGIASKTGWIFININQVSSIVDSKATSKRKSCIVTMINGQKITWPGSAGELNAQIAQLA